MAETMPRVLVVDDDWDTRTVIHDYLSHWDCPVSQAADAVEALAQIVADPPDVILLDIGLPDVPGTDLFTAIQVQCPNTAVIFVTALNEAEQAAEMMKQGAFHYLVKPIQMSRLWAVVQEVWAARQRRLEKTAPLHKLTPREREVLVLLGEGKTDGEMAEVLGVSVRTIKAHVSGILSKLRVSGRLQAALMWQQVAFKGKIRSFTDDSR